MKDTAGDLLRWLTVCAHASHLTGSSARPRWRSFFFTFFFPKEQTTVTFLFHTQRPYLPRTVGQMVGSEAHGGPAVTKAKAALSAAIAFKLSFQQDGTSTGSNGTAGKVHILILA